METIPQLSTYQAPQTNHWQGRQSNPDLPPQYWHQAVRLHNLQAEDNAALPTPQDSREQMLALVGYASHAGVIRNQGRPGAAEGPQAMRRALARVAWHRPTVSAWDMGDVRCVGDQLEDCQNDLSQLTHALLMAGFFPILMGGGHDITYGGVTGVLQFLKEKKIGIINFDAHFDLRPPLQDRPTSGTSFYQLLHQPHPVGYLVMGIQAQANPPELFDIAHRTNARYLMHDAFGWHNRIQIEQTIRRFAQEYDAIYLTIDLDGFSSAYAPGVSAPSPLGFDPELIRQCIGWCFSTQKVIACDIAELNPRFDRDGQTATLAARLLDTITEQRALYPVLP
ncbi:MAG: formimidoylglutamase [Bernardetiaceae bacterium]